jgi:transcriptional regulator with XRE-family HTH domain
MVIAIDHLLTEARRRRSLPPPAIRRLLRKHAGLTQAEVATVLGVRRPAVTRYETGARDPRGEVRLAYVELLERLARSPE